MRRLTISLILTVLFLLMISPAQTQDENVPFRIGRGDVEAVQWHPKGLYVMVSSVTGAWIYTDTLEDVTHIPDLQLASITPDGKYITGTVDGQTIQFWDASTFEFVKEENTILHQITNLVWSPDSHHIAVAGNRGLDFVQIYDFSDEAISTHQFYTYSGYVSADFLSWNRTGQYLAIMDMETAEVQVWDVYSKSLYFQDKPTSGGGADVLEWSKCNHLVRIQIDEILTTTFWNMNTREVIADRNTGRDTAFSPKDCSYLSSGAIKNSYTDEIIANIDNSFNISHPIWNADGSIVAFSGWYFSGAHVALQLFDVVQGKYLDATLPQTAVYDVAWHPWKSYVIAVGTQNDLYAYYVDQSRITGSQHKHATVSNIIEWNPTQPELAVAHPLDGVVIWNIESQEIIYHYATGLKPMTGLAWQPNGQYLTTYVVSDGWPNTDPTIVLFDTINGGIPLRFTLPDDLRPPNLDWHPTEPQLAVAPRSSKAYVWDVDSQNFIHEIKSYDGSTFTGNIHWSHDGASIALPESSSGNGGSILLHNIESSESVYVASAYATAWAWSSDNQVVWFSWDSYGCGGYSPPWIRPQLTKSDWEQSVSLSGMTKQTQKGFVSPNGTYGVALDEDGNGLIWDIRTADVLAMLSDVKNLAWSEDESKLAIQRMDKALMILSPTGQVLEYIAPSVSFAPRNRYAGQFGDLKWSADGTYLAHSHDGVIDVWTPSKVTPSKSETNTTTPAIDLSDMERVILSVLIAISAMMGLTLIHNLRRQRSFSKRKRD